MRQYKSDLYPFYCDFYIKSLDLYIEYQGGWAHGPKEYHQPFDPNNPHHIQELNRLKTKNNEHQFPNNNYWAHVINTWTNKDPVKRQIAKDNRINIIELFTLKDFNNWFKSIN